MLGRAPDRVVGYVPYSYSGLCVADCVGECSKIALESCSCVLVDLYGKRVLEPGAVQSKALATRTSAELYNGERRGGRVLVHGEFIVAGTADG